MTSTPSTAPLLADPPLPENATASTAAARPPGRTGRILGWVLVVALLVGVALLSFRLVVTTPDLTSGLNPEGPGPQGAKAITELTRQQGIRVEVLRSRTAAASAVGSGDVLVLTDPPALSDDAVSALITSADHVVILSTSARMLRLLGLGDDSAGSGPVEPGCDLPEFSRVGGIEADRLFTPAAGVDGCFTDPDGRAAVLRGSFEGTTVTLVEATRLLSNEHLAENGNAALGLALLAQGERVVWYVPSFADGDIEDAGPDTLGDLTPGWVAPAILLLLLAGLSAVWARGRRFGPLVTESLPVTVRASETMHGRARLTARAADAEHAGAPIRAGTRTRLAKRLALSPRSTPQQIADAASDRLGIPRGSLLELLDGPAPQSDRDLIDLARRLSELETAVDSAVHATVHTERNSS